MRVALVYLLALGAVAAAVLLLFPDLLGEPSAGDAEPGPRVEAPPPVVVAHARRSSFADTLQALGTIFANESVAITPNRADHVVATHFNDGQHVKEGDLLVEMNATEEKALLAEATAVRDDRNLNHARAKELFESSLMSEREYLASKALLAASIARVLSLEAAIADRQITAPFSGVLGLRRVSVGAYLQPSTLIATLDDLSVVKLDFTIPETWLSLVGIGMKIAARSDAWRNETFTGKVTALDTRLDPKTRSATIRAMLPNPDLKLRPGMLIKVTIDLGEEPVIQIPEEALISIGEGHFVLRVGAKDIAERVPVTIGRRRVGSVEVTAGLKEGDRVIVEGIVRVRPGTPVRVARILNSRI